MPRYFRNIVAGVNADCEIPNQCPICHHTVTIPAPTNMTSTNRDLQALYVCPNDDCRSFFIAYYSLDENGKAILTTLKPTKVETPAFPDIIEKLSPSFISIYREATEAKEIGLSQIAGPGFRKAFEFLIKDYAKSLPNNSAKTDEIEKSFSGDVVQTYINDPRIQAVAERALWLGNDESHYLRKWEKHNMDDLLTLIRLTIHHIETEHLSNKYVQDLKRK